MYCMWFDFAVTCWHMQCTCEGMINGFDCLNLFTLLRPLMNARYRSMHECLLLWCFLNIRISCITSFRRWECHLHRDEFLFSLIVTLMSWDWSYCFSYFCYKRWLIRIYLLVLIMLCYLFILLLIIEPTYYEKYWIRIMFLWADLAGPIRSQLCLPYFVYLFECQLAVSLRGKHM